MKIGIIVFLFISFISGCSQTRTVTYTETKKEYDLSIPKAGDELKGKNCEIDLTDGNSIPGQIIDIRPDTVFFVHLVTHDRSAVRTEQIQSITSYNHFAGALQGLFLGTLSGAIGTGGTFYLLSKSSGNADESAWWGVWLGGMAGGLVGFVYGTLHGSGDVYEFQK